MGGFPGLRHKSEPFAGRRDSPTAFGFQPRQFEASTPRDGGLSIVRLAAPEARKWPGAAVLHALAYHAPRIGWRRHAMRFKHLLTWRCVGASRFRPHDTSCRGLDVRDGVWASRRWVGLLDRERIENALPTTGAGLASWPRRCPSWDAARLCSWARRRTSFGSFGC